MTLRSRRVLIVLATVLIVSVLAYAWTSQGLSNAELGHREAHRMLLEAPIPLGAKATSVVYQNLDFPPFTMECKPRWDSHRTYELLSAINLQAFVQSHLILGGSITGTGTSHYRNQPAVEDIEINVPTKGAGVAHPTVSYSYEVLQGGLPVLRVDAQFALTTSSCVRMRRAT
jgi:hypothetical protein